MNTILAIDDEKDQLSILNKLLERDYNFYGFEEANSLFERIDDCRPDLIILDKHLGQEKNGIDIIESIRDSKYSNIPIVVITGDGDDASLEEAIDSGADDFIPKPFTIKQLQSRLKANLRRASCLLQDSQLLFKGLSIDKVNKRVLHNDNKVIVTEIERQILTVLVGKANSTVSRDELFNACTIKGNTREVSLNVHICTLRKKLKAYGLLIKTIRNEGYILSSR